MAAASVLAEQYVDIVARGLRETLEALRGIQRQSDLTGQSLRRLQGDIRNAGSAQAGMARGGSGSAGGMLGGMLGGAGAMAGLVAGIGAITAALAPLVSLITLGFSGTVELEQFGMAVMQIARELAALFAPALRMATDVLNGLTAAFRATGAAGQTTLLHMLGPLGYLFDILANPAVQQSMAALVSSFVRLAAAMEPLLTAGSNLLTIFLDLFAAGPLSFFIDGLTLVVELVTEFAKQIVIGMRAIASLFGFSHLFNAPDRRGREVRLNQTGTEDAQGTFQRIQQAVLKAGIAEEKPQDPVVAKLDGILNAAIQLTALVGWAQGFMAALMNGLSNLVMTVLNTIRLGFGGGGGPPGNPADIFRRLMGR